MLRFSGCFDTIMKFPL